MTRKDGVPPELSGFRLRPRPRARDRELQTPEAVGNAVALLLADLSRREHLHQNAPLNLPRKDQSTALRATHSAATATEGGTPRGKAWVTWPRGQRSAGIIPQPNAALYTGRTAPTPFLRFRRKILHSLKSPAFGNGKPCQPGRFSQPPPRHSVARWVQGRPGGRRRRHPGRWALGPGAGQGAVVWVRGDGRAPRAGCQERGQEKVEVHLRLVPGRIRGSGRSPPGWSTRPHAGQHIGRSVCSFPRRRGRGGLGHGAPTAFVGNFILPAFLSSKLRLHRRDLMLSRLF